MACRVLPLLAMVAVLALAGCGRFDRAERPAWRDQAEEACLAQHLVSESAAIQPARPIDGPGICGLNHPFKVYALAGGTVRLNTASILDCSMIPVLDAWIKDVVQPDAQARFGEPVAQIDTMGTYSCRGINGMSGAKLSEHAFANAMDVGGFTLASGRSITVVRGWKSADPQESAFLHDAHAGACGYFTTVLGPGYNIFHYNHVHVDLAMHGNTSRGPRRYCKPVPDQPQAPAPKLDNLPDPPAIDEELDIAQAAPAPSYAARGTSFVASAPAAPATYRSPTRFATRAPSAPLALAPMAGPPPAPFPRPDRSLDIDQAGGVPPAAETVPAEWDITALIKSEQAR